MTWKMAFVLDMSCLKVNALLVFGILAGLPASARDVVGIFDEALADPAPSRAEVYKSIGGNDLKVHIFEPPAEVTRNGAALLWIHGGGWKQGSSDQLFPHAAYFARLGYVTASVEYRLAGENSAIFDAINDSRDAFYWMWSNADALGIDPEKIVVAGESAGGHLAACLGTIDDPRSSGVPSPQPLPAAIIAINPVMDLTALNWAMQVPGLTPGEVSLGQSISPQFHVDASSVPVLLLHGADDGVVPPGQSSDFAEAMHQAGRPAKLRLWEGKSHAFFLFLPESNLVDKDIIHSSLLEIEAFLQSLKLDVYPDVHGHFAPVHLFAGSDGFRSFSELTEINGKLYGSTYQGGPDGGGVVFAFDPVTMDHELLHTFSGADGREIFTGLTTDGAKLYGVGKFGGSDDGGVLFEMQLDGTGFSVLHHFNKSDNTGFYPHAAPVLIDGALYGTTYHGGSSRWGGVLYKYTLPSGPYEVIHSFIPETGRHPTGQMIRIGDWLYGTASDLFQHSGGHFGSLFRIRLSDHTFELLHAFDGDTEGSHPYDDLLFDGVDALIGTNMGEAFNAASKGVIFSYSLSEDTLTVLHDFGTRPQTGSKPNSALIEVDDTGHLYGITHGSNAEGGDLGNLFRINTDGSGFQIYHVFTSGLMGNTPMRSLTYLDGAFYGVTAFGGLTPDIDNPETGPGMIFRYEPKVVSVETSAYIEWLSEFDRLVNQCSDADPDRDGWSFIEEFTFVGYPDQADGGRPLESGFSESRDFTVTFPIVRSDMTGQIVPLASNDLNQWALSHDHALAMRDHPDAGDGFKALAFEWPETAFSSEPLFVSFEISLP